MDIKTVLFAAVAAAGFYVYFFKDSVIENLEYYKDDLTFTTMDEDLIEFLRGKAADKKETVENKVAVAVESTKKVL